MRSVLILAAAILGSYPARAPAQETQTPMPNAEYGLRTPREDRSADLWYGASGIRPGGDLLGPILEVLRKPSGLLDFRPREIPSWLPDRETAEAFRERR